jgi:hypothetical protein
MEVESSGDFLDCSGYWLVALVADNSHVLFTSRWKGALEKMRVSISAITSYAKPGRLQECEQCE